MGNINRHHDIHNDDEKSDSMLSGFSNVYFLLRHLIERRPPEWEKTKMVRLKSLPSSDKR